MSDTQQQTQAPETEATDSGSEQEQQGEQQKEQTFTQADVDRIVKERVQRERAKYSDYNDLKAKAGEAKTAEDRIADLEKQYKAAESRALRASIASDYGIPAEDRDMLLTGEDEETLTAQAQRLAERESERKKRSNHVPAEGNNPTAKDDPTADFLRRATGRD